MLAEARRLRDNAQFAEAVKLLDAHLQGQPDDVEAARLRAQTLYWLKDFAKARSAYAEALRRHPDHEALRLDYARVLMETGDLRMAMTLLNARHQWGSGFADAATLRGTILYWQGDLAAATRSFKDALARNPEQQDAARQLREIRLLTSPWLRVTPAVWHDDQPLDHAGVALEAGWFLTPLTTMSLRSQPVRHSTALARTFWQNELEISHVHPGARLETRLGAGAFRRPGENLRWTGRASLGLRAAGGITLRGHFERAPYLFTLASLETPILTNRLAGTVQLDTRGWLGEAALQRQAFPDANVVRSAYAWLLGPLVNESGQTFQAGYAFAAADADEDRFVLARPQQAFSPADPGFDFSGVYDPYYTPARSVTHSLIGAFRIGKPAELVLRGGGSYGFRAREDATAFYSSGGELLSVIGRRSYTPWSARASLEIPANPSFTFTVAGESGATAYYRWTGARLDLHYRFVAHDTRGSQLR